MHQIRHDSLQHGHVQSLTIVMGKKDSQEVAAFVVLPGVYRLEKMKRPVTIKVVAGQMLVNGKTYDHRNGSCTVKAGEELRISATDGVICLCYYR